MEKKEYSVGARFWIRFKWLNRTRATAYLGADGADADAVDHAARVAVVPVLVHKHPAQSRMLEICISLENTSHTQNGSTPSAS